MIIIENQPKSRAELYMELLAEFKPDWKVLIIEEDYNLFKLGFVKEIPCTLQLNVSTDEIRELYDEIIDMEVDVYQYENILNKPLYMISDQEKELKARVDEAERIYRKFVPLEGMCWTIFNNE